MAKRGRKPKHPGLFEGLNPETTREVGGVVIFVLSLVSILSFFNLGGSFGQGSRQLLIQLLGLPGYILPIFGLLLAIYLFAPDRLAGKRRPLWGIFFVILLLAGLIHPEGGLIGKAVWETFSTLLGKAGGYLVLIALTLVALLLSFNLSLRELYRKFVGTAKPLPRISPEEGRVSVFATVRRKIGLGKPKEIEVGAKVVTSTDETWEFPPLDLLELATGKASSGNIAKNVDILKKTLEDFGIEVGMGEVNVGPTVTQYQLKPAEGVKLNQITARSDDLALALAAHPVRVEAPIPGKSAVGVEVPNKVPAPVSLREILESKVFKERTSPLSLALGRDVAGHPQVVDLAKMPHLLIAGATGSGKSVAINAMVLTLIYQNSPRDLRLLLVDPKRVEFTAYTGIPHLLAPVVTEVDKTINLLRWLVAEMDRRFRLFAKVGARNIELYNQSLKSLPPDEEGMPRERMPYIVLFIDELADLMAQAANEVEAAIVRLAQLARATGIHLVVATQRPSVDVITGLIKANITSRIAFAVASQVDSRTIIDQAGAEKLLGNGDMLFIGAELGKPRRIQGVIVKEAEVKKVTDFLKREGQAVYDPEILEYQPQGVGITGGRVRFAEDPLYREAAQLVVQAGKASASLLQRRLKVGYARAARLLDMLEQNGLIGPAEGAKPRDILVDSLELPGGEEEEGKGVSDDEEIPSP